MLFSLSAISQDTYWIEAMSDPNANYFKACESFNTYWKGKEKVKHAGIKQFERWRTNVEPYVKPSGQIEPYRNVWDKAIAYNNQIASRSANGNWVEVGPWQEKNYSRGVGRLNVIAFHPTDANTFYVGSPSGGIWITRDNGKTWFAPKDDIMNFGVSAIAVDPFHPDTIYIGTGDAGGLDTDGTGVYKSEDGGKTWVRKSLGMNDKTVTKIIIDPDSSDILIASTRDGIFKSTNGAGHWVKKQMSGDYRDLEFHPTNSNVVYTAQWTYPGVASFVFVSKNKGETWERRFIPNNMYPDMRYEIEVSNAEPDKLFAVGEKWFYKSDNSGDSFKLVTDSGDFLLDRNRQGWYNASFEIDPNNADIMYCGNVRLYKTIDGGNSWFRLNQTHADNHFIAVHPITSDLYVLDDGGIHRSADGGNTFEDLTNLGVSAIYSIAQSPFNAKHVLQGYQDCGSKYYDGYTWTSVYGADGMQPLFDGTDSNIFYTAYQYGHVVRHLKHIGSAQVIEEPSDEGGWVTPYILDANDNQTMYQGRENLWKTSNLHTKDRKQVTWKNISNGHAANVGRYLKVKLHRTNSARIFAIVQNSNRSQSKLVKCDNIYDTNYVWNYINTIPQVNLYADFETDNSDSNKIYIILNHEVFQSNNAGATFSSVTENLPNVPHHVLELDTVTGNLYLGSDAGVFVRPKGDTNWVSFSSGLTGVARVRDLDIYYHPTDHSQSMIKAATYGRGLWESDLYGSGTLKESPSAAHVLPLAKYYGFNAKFKVEISFKNHLALDSVTGFSSSKIIVKNGKVLSLVPNGKLFEVEVEANNYGMVELNVPNAAATSVNSGLPTDSALTFKYEYLEQPVQIGPFGPGGVGDSNSLMMWINGSTAMTDSVGDTLKRDGDKIARWYDKAGKGFYAEQMVDSSKPSLRLNGNGIAGWPAVEYNPPNRFLMMRDFTPVGENITVFAVAQSNTPKWTGHSWIANSREHNGFMFHNSNNAKSVYSSVLDRNKKYLNSASVDWPNVQEPHVYAIQFNGRMWKNQIYLDDRVGIDYLTKPYYRDGNDTISIRLGKDYRTRYGDGKLGEMIYYKEDLGTTKRIIVTNYLAAKYGVDLRSEACFPLDSTFKHYVSGIGKTSDIDYHHDAKGELIRINNPAIPVNGNYLLWGNNGLPLQWDSVKTGNGYLLHKKWRVAETGDFGTITFQIDTNELGLKEQELGLKIGTLTELTDGTKGRIIPLKRIGQFYQVDVDFNDEDYFTLISGEDLNSEIEQYSARSKFAIQPNPSNNGLSTIFYNSTQYETLSVSVYSTQGRLILQKDLHLVNGLNQLPINLNEQSTGIYLVELKAGNDYEVLRLVR